MIFAATAIYLAMKARVAWYDWMRWEPNSDYTAVSAIALPIDRYATMLAIIGRADRLRIHRHTARAGARRRVLPQTAQSLRRPVRRVG